MKCGSTRPSLMNAWSGLILNLISKDFLLVNFRREYDICLFGQARQVADGVTHILGTFKLKEPASRKEKAQQIESTEKMQEIRKEAEELLQNLKLEAESGKDINA